jgi:hypothetical protein
MQIPMCLTSQQVQPGDWVRVVVPRFGGVLHHGIVRRLLFVAGGIAVEVIHNTKDEGVMVSEWSEFAGHAPVHLHRRPDSPEDAAATVARAEANLGKPYYLFAQNCEHFASFAFTGEAESKTLQGLGWMAAGLAAIAFLTTDNR